MNSATEASNEELEHPETPYTKAKTSGPIHHIGNSHFSTLVLLLLHEVSLPGCYDKTAFTEAVKIYSRPTKGLDLFGRWLK